jgi:hypothetical protein
MLNQESLSEMGLSELQELRKKSKGEEKKEISRAIDMYFFPQKPQKIRKKDKKRTPRFNEEDLY